MRVGARLHYADYQVGFTDPKLTQKEHGGDRKSKDASRTLISQEDIAKELGIT